LPPVPRAAAIRLSTNPDRRKKPAFGDYLDAVVEGFLAGLPVFGDKYQRKR